MNSKFIMDILNNPEKYTSDQRKIAVRKAIEMLDKMADDAPQANSADAEEQQCPYCGGDLVMGVVCRTGCGRVLRC